MKKEIRRTLWTILLVCFISAPLISCDGEELVDETKEFEDSIEDYNDSFDGHFRIKVIDKSDDSALDFTYYYQQYMKRMA